MEMGQDSTSFLRRRCEKHPCYASVCDFLPIKSFGSLLKMANSALNQPTTWQSRNSLSEVVICHPLVTKQISGRKSGTWTSLHRLSTFCGELAQTLSQPRIIFDVGELIGMSSALYADWNRKAHLISFSTVRQLFWLGNTALYA